MTHIELGLQEIETRPTIVPDGYVLVPKEPTEEMCEAMGEAIEGELHLVDMRLSLVGLAGYHAYKAMLSAAPQVQAEKVDFEILKMKRPDGTVRETDLTMIGWNYAIEYIEKHYNITRKTK